MSAKINLLVDIQNLDIPILLFELSNGKVKIMDRNKISENLVDELEVINILDVYFKTYQNIKKEIPIYRNLNSVYEMIIEKEAEHYVLLLKDVSREKLLQYRLEKTQSIAKLGDWENDLLNKKEFWSKEIYELLGLDGKYNKASIELFAKHIHPEDYKRIIDINNSSFDNINEYNVEFRIITASGEERWMFTHGTKEFNEEGELIKLFGTMQDITTYKELESEIVEEKKKTEAASQAKSQFLANMSHEIRTPLNGILGMANTLRRELNNLELKSYVNNIKYSADSLLQVVGDILDFSKIESGSMKINNQAFDFEIMISNIEHMFKYKCKEKNLIFDIDIDQAVPKFLFGDYVRLQQVLINLLGNAIKFTQVGKIVLKISLKNIEYDKMLLHIEVIDTGIGISKNMQEIIFDIYEQGERGHEYNGTGLGLPISKKILGLMGSELLLESSIGKGSNFYFDLEVGVVENIVKLEDISIENYDIDKQCSLKILIAEDDSVSRIYISKLLDNVLNHEVLLSKDGIECIELYKKNAVDLVLVDTKMPRASGLDVIKYIRKFEIENNLDPIKIILMSAEASNDIADISKNDGADYFLLKPINELKLLEILNSIKKEIQESLDDSNKNNLSFEFKYIDIDGIKQSNKLMGTDKMQMIIKFAIEEYEIVIEKIQNCVNEKYFDTEIVQNLHKIKGTIGYFSAIKIAKSLPEIESIFSDKYTEENGKRVSMFIYEFGKFIEELTIYSNSEV